MSNEEIRRYLIMYRKGRADAMSGKVKFARGMAQWPQAYRDGVHDASQDLVKTA